MGTFMVICSLRHILIHYLASNFDEASVRPSPV